MIVDQCDTRVDILPDDEAVENGMIHYCVSLDKKTGRAELATLGGTFLEQCSQRAFDQLMMHVATCEMCTDLFLAGPKLSQYLNHGETAEGKCVWMLDCGYRVIQSALTFESLLKVVKDELVDASSSIDGVTVDDIIDMFTKDDEADDDDDYEE